MGGIEQVRVTKGPRALLSHAHYEHLRKGGEHVSPCLEQESAGCSAGPALGGGGISSSVSAALADDGMQSARSSGANADKSAGEKKRTGSRNGQIILRETEEDSVTVATA